MSMQDHIRVPDRYESLSRQLSWAEISQVVEKVPGAINQIDRIFATMQTANRGSFVVLRGDSGSGKSTFLHTLKVFKEDVETISIPGTSSIRDSLELAAAPDHFQVFVLEEREAAVSFTDVELETWLHQINGFLRTDMGRRILVVWPCNTDTLMKRIIPLAKSIGGRALLAGGEGVIRFNGPEKGRFIDIAGKTLSIANQSASLADLGLSDARLARHVDGSNLIGDFFANIQEDILELQAKVLRLVDKEQCRLWVVVIAGNEPDGDVAGLTRGANAAIDTERLLSATGANVVSDLKRYPDKIGIVGTVLDAKIFHLPVLAANAIIREFASDTLKVRLDQRKFLVQRNAAADALDRIVKTDFAAIISGGVTGVRNKRKLGSKSIEAFEKLAAIAEKNDSELNAAIGECLKGAGLAKSYSTEKKFGREFTTRSDLVLETSGGR